MSGVGGDTATFELVAPYWWVTNFGGIVANGIIAARSKKRIAKPASATRRSIRHSSAPSCRF